MPKTLQGKILLVYFVLVILIALVGGVSSLNTLLTNFTKPDVYALLVIIGAALLTLLQTKINTTRIPHGKPALE